MPMDELRRLRDKKIQHIVRLCYDKVPFYREHMNGAGVKPDDVKTYDDLQRFRYGANPNSERGRRSSRPTGPS